MAEVVRELAAKLSLQTDRASFKAGDAAINATKENLRSIPEAAGAIRAALAGVVGYGFKKAFVDFNSEIEQSVIALAAVQKMFKGTEWGASMETASKLVEHYQEVAKKSVGETRDFIEMHKSVAASAYQAGASLEDVKEITRGAVIAASAMGESAFITSMDIKQALTKGVEIRDRFMIQLLASQKMTKETFNAMSKAQRVETLKKMLTAEWIQDASRQMEGSFAGVVSTLRDTLKITMGKIGLPLFKAITAEIAKWNKWLEKNPNNVFFDQVGRGISEATSAFKILGGAIGGAVEILQTFNKETDRLKKLAGEESWITKVFQAIANPIKEAYETLRDIVDFMSGEASALGLQMATARGEGKAYMEHAQRGGKFDALGRIVAPHDKNAPTPAGAAVGAVGGFIDKTTFGGGWAGLKRGVATGNSTDILGGIAGMGLGAAMLPTEAALKGAYLSGERAMAPRSPWADIPYSPGVKVSSESLTSSMPGPWAFSPPPVLASGLSTPEPVKLTGQMNVNVKVEAVADTKTVSEDHSTELRASGALYSSEPY